MRFLPALYCIFIEAPRSGDGYTACSFTCRNNKGQVSKFNRTLVLLFLLHEKSSLP